MPWTPITPFAPLYESKDKYGFSHVTFREYLAARLILASRKNILDFNYGLEKLKSGELFFNFLILHTLESIVDTLSTDEILKLMNLADLREILHYFPGTTEEDIKEFHVQ